MWYDIGLNLISEHSVQPTRTQTKTGKFKTKHKKELANILPA